MFEFKIALQFLLCEKRGTVSFLTLISLIGVCIGVAALIIVLSVMNGFTQELQNNLLNTSPHIHILKKDSSTFNASAQILKQLRDIPEIVGVSPSIEEEMILSTNHSSLGVVMKAIDPKTIDQVMDFSKSLEKISPLSQTQPTIKLLNSSQEIPKIIVGSEIARRLRIYDEEKIKLISPFETMGPAGGLPKTKQFEVVGSFRSGVLQVDSQYVFIHLAEGQKLINAPDRIEGLDIRLKDPFALKKFMGKIATFLDSFEIVDWKQKNENLFYAFQLEKIAMFIILSFAILIASFSILSTLFMMVTNKLKNISILQALGARPKQIQKIFTFQGLMIGGCGTVLGLVVGLIICFLIPNLPFLKLPDIYYSRTIPVSINFLSVIFIAMTGILLSYLVTILPSRRASKITPLEGIQFEK
ncbi:MAG: ABC transporter permease [Deltaproteobacteria bacterium]|nr:ABC transporter permease [Deltaproteobacteria bacterium]